MSLRDELASASGESHPGNCAVAQWLDTLAMEDRRAFEAAVADAGIQTITLWKIASAHGFGFTQSPIGRHRRGECKCAR